MRIKKENDRRNTNFLITEEHLRRGKQDNPRENPLALALRENGLINNPAAHPTRTLETDNQGRKLRTYQHGPPVNRWLNSWNRGETVLPMELSLDFRSRRISTSRRKAKERKERQEENEAQPGMGEIRVKQGLSLE